MLKAMRNGSLRGRAGPDAGVHIGAAGDRFPPVHAWAENRVLLQLRGGIDRQERR
jgi:hypothetical protein